MEHRSGLQYPQLDVLLSSTLPFAAGEVSPRPTGDGFALCSPAADPCSPCAPGGGAGSSEGATARRLAPVYVPSSPTFRISHMGVSGKMASTHDVVDFGGIQDCAALGLRSSWRIRSQPNADAT